MQLRILLISPKSSTQNLLWRSSYLCELYSKITGRKTIFPCYSLALPLIAALIHKEFPKSTIKLVDENIEDIDFKASWDLVCISSNTIQMQRALELARIFSKTTTVIIGGPHFVRYDKDIYNEVSNNAHSIVFGDTDSKWKEILEDFRQGNLKPVYKESRNVENLSDLPLPRIDLIKLDSYLYRAIETSRGCDRYRQCYFCNVSKKLHFKEIENVINEIKHLRSIEKKQNAEIRSIFFTDNLLNPKNDVSDRSKMLMESLIKYKEQKYLGDEFSWSGQADYNIRNDPKLIELMSKAGALRLLIGFESLYDYFNKDDPLSYKEKKQMFLDTINKVRNKGIDVIGSFIIGYDEEPDSVFQDLEDFINEASLFAVQILVLTPFPGTEAYLDFQKQGRLIKNGDGTIDWSQYDGYHFVFSGKNLEKKQQDCEKFLKKIYNFDETIIRLARRGQVFLENSARRTLISDILFAKNYHELSKKIGGD